MKHYKVIFSQQALKDLNEANVWYNLQQKGLGKRLIADVKSGVSFIKQNPILLQ